MACADTGIFWDIFTTGCFLGCVFGGILNLHLLNESSSSLNLHSSPFVLWTDPQSAAATVSFPLLATDQYNVLLIAF